MCKLCNNDEPSYIHKDGARIDKAEAIAIDYIGDFLCMKARKRLQYVVHAGSDIDTYIINTLSKNYGSKVYGIDKMCNTGYHLFRMNKERCLIKRKAWIENNKEKYKASQRSWYLKNKEKSRESTRRWREKLKLSK